MNHIWLSCCHIWGVLKGRAKSVMSHQTVCMTFFSFPNVWRMRRLNTVLKTITRFALGLQLQPAAVCTDDAHIRPQCWACDARGRGDKVTECWLRTSCKFHRVYNTRIAIKTGVLWKLHLLLSNLSLHREITFCHLTTHLTFWKVSELSIIKSILRSLRAIQSKAEDQTTRKVILFHGQNKRQLTKRIPWGMVTYMVSEGKFFWDFGDQVSCHTLRDISIRSDTQLMASLNHHHELDLSH